MLSNWENQLLIYNEGVLNNGIIRTLSELVTIRPLVGFPEVPAGYIRYEEYHRNPRVRMASDMNSVQDLSDP